MIRDTNGSMLKQIIYIFIFINDSDTMNRKIMRKYINPTLLMEMIPNIFTVWIKEGFDSNILTKSMKILGINVTQIDGIIIPK